MSKIFVRERRKTESGEKKPRFRVIGVTGSDIKVYVKHVRKKELNELAKEPNVEVVYMASGKDRTGSQDGSGCK